MRYYDDPEMPECPICGEECNSFYVRDDGEIVGCDRCISTTNAYERAAEDKLNAQIDMGYERYLERGWNT